MSEEFRVLVSATLDEASIGKIKSQINGIKTNPIKIKIDTSDIKNQISGIKKQIESLNATPSALKTNKGGQTSYNTQNINEVINAYRDLMNIQRQISSTRIKLNGLDPTKNSQQISALSSQLQRLQTDYNNIFNTFNKKLSVDQLDNLNRAFKTTNDRITTMNADMADDSAIKKKESAYKELLNLSKQISNTEIKIGGLKGISGHENEVAALENQLTRLKTTYQELSTSNQGNLSSGQLKQLEQVVQNTSSKLEILNGRIQDTKQRLAETSLGKFADDASKIDKIQEKFSNLKNKTSEVDTAMRKFSESVSNMNAAKQSGDVNKIIDSYKKYGAELKNVTRLVNDASNAQNLSQSRTALSSQMDIWLKNYGASAGQTTSQVRALQAELQSCDATRLSSIKSEFQDLKRQVELTGTSTNTFKSAFTSLAKPFISMVSYTALATRSIGAVKDAFNDVLQVDTAMTELYRITDLTSQQYDNLYDNMINSAKEYGTSLSDTINSVADWARLGFDPQTESKRMAEITSMYQHVTDLDNETAINNLVTAYKGFETQLQELNGGDSTKSVEMVADVYDKLGNEFAVSAANVGEALTNCASSMELTGNTFQETAAMATGIIEVTQDPSKAGNSLKILGMRLRGMKGELEELGEDVDENVESLSKMQTQVLNLTHGKVNIFDDNGDFKSPYEIMQGIAEIYDDLTSTEQASLLETIAGKNRGNEISALISNWSNVEKAFVAATNAEGTAAEEQEKYMDSLQGRLDVLSASKEALSAEFMDSDFLKGAVDGVTGFLDVTTNLISTLGTIPTLAGTISAALSFKNVGFAKIAQDTETFAKQFSFLGKTINKSTFVGFGASIKSYFNDVDGGFKAGNGILNVFKPKNVLNAFVSKKDIAAAKSYNDAINSYGSTMSKNEAHAKAYSSSMEGASNSMKQVAAKANGAVIPMDNLGTSMLKAKAGMVAMRAGSLLLNTALSVGLSMAVTGIVSAISQWMNKEKEARQNALETAKSAREESAQIKDLYSTYQEVSEARKNGSASMGDMYKAAFDMCDALGVERSRVEELTKSYKGLSKEASLDKAMRQIAKEETEKNRGDLLEGYDAAKKELVDKAKSVYKVGLEFDATEGSKEIIDALKKSKLIDPDDVFGDIFGGGYINFDKIQDADDAIERYEQLIEMRDSLIDKAKSGELDLNEDELAGNDTFKNIQKGIKDLEAPVEEYKKSLDGIMDDLASTEYNDYIDKYGIPETRQEYEALKKSIEGAIEKEEGFSISQDRVNDSVHDFLSDIPELSKFFYNASAPEVTIGDKKYNVESIDNLKESSTGAIESISKLNEVLGKQTTGVGISIDDFNAEELRDYQSALEYVNGTMQINADKAKEIARAKADEQIAVNETNKALKQAQYMQNAQEIQELRNELYNLDNFNSDRAEQIMNDLAGYRELNKGLLNECDQIDVLNSSMEESLSLYNEWKNAQNGPESGDMFDDAISAYSKINDVLNNSDSDLYGRIGREDYKTSLDFILPEAIDRDDKEAINGYLDSVKSYFEFNNDTGEIKTIDTEKFCQDAVDKGLMVLDEASDSYEIAGGTLMEDIARGMNISMPMLRAIFGEMEEFGAEFDWSDEFFDSFNDKAVHLEARADELREKLDELYYKKRTGQPVNQSELDSTIAELKQVEQQKSELSEDVSFRIEAKTDLQDQLTKAKDELQAIELQFKSGKISKSEYKVKVDEALANISKAENALNEIPEVKETDVQVRVEEIDSQIADLEHQLTNLGDESFLKLNGIDASTAESEIARIKSEIQSLTNEKAEITASVNAETDSATSQLEAVQGIEIEDKQFLVVALTSAALAAISAVKGALASIPATTTTTVTVIRNNITNNITSNSTEGGSSGGSHRLNGTAHASGTAYASGTAKLNGDWGNKQPGMTLVGELGREIVVSRNSGKWYTVGDNGAEFRYIPKDAIVFNHEQTEDLLSKGFVSSRAMALASGTALSSGNAMVGGSIPRKSPTQTSNPSTPNVIVNNSPNTTVNTAAPASTATPASSSSSSDSKEEKTALDKFKEWFSKLFDWIEVRMKIYSDRIDKYVERAKNAKESGKYNISVKNYRKAINVTTAQISDEQKAIKKYSSQADDILQNALSQGVISDGEVNEIKNSVKNGRMDFSQYRDEIQEVIKSYQTWYDKSKDARKALDELHNNIRTYIKDLYDVRVAQRDAKLDKIDAYTSIGTSGFSSTLKAQNNQLNFSNLQLKRQDKAYDKEVSAISKDTTKLGKSDKKDIKKALKSKAAKGKSKSSKAYKKSLNNAKRAIKAKKAVSKADLNKIKSHSISLYNKLYAYNLSLDNLEDARLEQAVNYASNSAERAENIAEKYKNKDDKIDNQISLLRLKSDNAISVKKKNKNLDQISSQYDKVIKNDKAEISQFKKSEKSNAKKIKKKSIKSITTSKYKKSSKKNKKNIKKFINKAKTAAKKGTIIDANTIRKLSEFYSDGYISKSFYQSCINYNDMIEYRKDAEEQLKTDQLEIKQKKAEIATEKFDNVKQKHENRLRTTKAAKNKEAIQQSIRTTKGIDLTAYDYNTMLNYSKKEEKIIEDEIAALAKTATENINSGEWTKGSQEYLDAIAEIDNLYQSLGECREEQEQLNNQMAELPYNVFDRALDYIKSVRANIQSVLSIKKVRGVAKTENDIYSEIDVVKQQRSEQIAKREQYRSDYQKALEDPNGVYGGKQASEWLTLLTEADTEVNNLTADVESLNNEVAQLPYDRYEKALKLLDGIARYNKSIANLTKAQGFDLTESDYYTQIYDNDRMASLYEEERNKKYNDYLTSLASPDSVYGGKTSNEWLMEYYELGATINDLKTNNEEIKDALRDDVYWRTFERAHKAAQMLADVLAGISGLIDDNMLFNKDGRYTDFGVAKIANIVKQYETAREEIQNYTNDIQNLNKLYSSGQYNNDEYTEKLNEFQNGLFDSASSMKTYLSEIIDMNKKLAQSELDDLFKIIDARNDALSAKKSYYDFDKTIKDKTKDIKALEAQIAALEGVEDSYEVKAKRAKLQADLSEKKEDLNDAFIEHQFEISKDALDELKKILQDEFDDRWDNIDSDLDELKKLIKAANDLAASQTFTVANSLNKLLSFYGIDPIKTETDKYIGYDSGVKKVDKDKLAWTQEHGKEEIIVRRSDGAILTPLSKNDGVIPNDLTDNLFDWGKQNPNTFLDNLVGEIPKVPISKTNQQAISISYGNMLNVEGNVDKNALPGLQTIVQRSYDYTVKKIAEDARKIGIKV